MALSVTIKSTWRKTKRSFERRALMVYCLPAMAQAQMPAGYLPGFLPAVNGEDNPAKVKELINKYHNGKGPYYIAEWYPGWFDSWGKPHSGSNADEDAKKLDEVLSAGISINMYMFHGGTTRDFMNGANMSRTEAYAPQTSSYDYDAPLG
jgi:beta-galactosidase